MTQQKISGISFALIGLVVFFVVPYQVGSDSSIVFPRIISILLFFFAFFLILLPGKQSKDEKKVDLFDPLLVLYMALVLVAVIVIQFVGFYPVIIVILPLILFLFGERDLKKIIPFSFLVAAVIYLVMDLILGSNLP